MASSLRYSSLSCLLLSALYTPTAAFEQAQPALQVFERQTFLGGWVMGIPGTECPSSVPVKCKGNYIENPACCPTGTFCNGLGELYCCPTESDCGVTVMNFPKCADPSWTMYKLERVANSYFCCPEGQFGVLPVSTKPYGGFCLPDGEAVAVTKIAAKATSAKATIISTARTVQTVTSLSTFDGKVTTIVYVTTPRVTLTQTSNAVGGATTVPTGTDSSSSTLSTSPPPAAGAGLGTGPIIGIAIGGLAVIALFLVAFLLYRRRRPAPPAYQPPTHQQQPDAGVYPTQPQQPAMGAYPTQLKSPALSNAGTATVVGSPPMEYAQPHQGYQHYGPPPPAAGYSEVHGQNTWQGPPRVEMGPGR